MKESELQISYILKDKRYRYTIMVDGVEIVESIRKFKDHQDCEVHAEWFASKLGCNLDGDWDNE
jgi:hypothetical protein